jgi:hypothetical protein
MKRKTGFVVEDYGEETADGYGNLAGKKVNPQQAIRMFCLACQGGSEYPWLMNDGKTLPPSRPYDEVKACTSTTCWLFPFRTGRDPYSKRTGNPANFKPRSAPHCGDKQG